MSVPLSTAALLLTWAAAFDNRSTPRSADEVWPAAEAWAAALHSTVSPADGKHAITAHYASSGEYVMPRHVNAGVRALRARRLAEALDPAPPDGLTAGEYREWLVECRRRIGDGMSPEYASREVREMMGLPDEARLVGPPPPGLAAVTGRGGVRGSGWPVGART